MDARDPHRRRRGNAADRDGWIPLAAFSSPVEAHLARARLEAEGVSCRLADEHLASLHGLVAPALGGVKLQVRAAQAGAARAILDEVERAGAAAHPGRRSARFVTGDLHAPRCASCGSLRVERAGLDRRLLLWSWALVGLPWLFVRRGLRCRDCGFEAKPEAGPAARD